MKLIKGLFRLVGDVFKAKMPATVTHDHRHKRILRQIIGLACLPYFG